ncbi:MAG: long-chain fatty acid--CoA ligase [Nocardiopsaceae bacterium]|nr:long-chain fatty acid--CoA ligase [Nocardiopsaceae bacterium]
MREYSIPALAEVPATANLADLVTRRAAEQPRAVMLRRQKADGSWTDITAAQFREDVHALAKGLIAAGIEPGDPVAIMSHTRYEWTVFDYAAWTAGAVVVPIYETASAEQAEWILADTSAKAVVVETEDFERLIGESRDRLSALRYVWRLERGLRELIAGGAAVSDKVVAERARTANAASPATIIYTSGTTGRSKGCKVTHENLLSLVRNTMMGPLASIHEVDNPSTVLFLPLAHVFARFIEVACLESGITLGHCGDLGQVLPALSSFQPTFILAVPRVFEKVYNSAEQKAAADGKGKIFTRASDVAVEWSRALDAPRGPSLGLRAQHLLFDKLVYGKLRAALGGRAEAAVSGGAALAPRLGHFFRGIGVPVVEGYGLTETSAPVSVNRQDRQKIGSVGQPIPGVAVRIDDDGEILVHGKSVIPAYWHNDQATKDSFTPDGWYRTGDIGMLDDEGFLTITGRKKEIIVTASGKNVSPALLEDRLRSHLLVSQCMVVGDGKPFIGALITIDEESFGPWKERLGKPAEAAVGDLRDDPDLVAAIQEAIDDANLAVSRAESIRKFRILDTDFTQEQGHLSAKLGIKRNVLAKEFASDIEALYR